MTADELRERLAECNLSLLSRMAQVDLRYLRRFKNEGGDMRTETIERIRPFLKRARQQEKQ